MPIEEKKVKEVFTRDQQHLIDCHNAMVRAFHNPREIERLKLAYADILSRLTIEEIKAVDMKTAGNSTLDLKKLAEDLKEMDQNRDSNSI